MNINWNLLAVFTAPIITVVLTFILNKFFYNRPYLVTYYGHTSSFKVQNPNNPPFYVYTHSIVIINTGRLSAKNVKLYHNVLPQNYNIEPDINHSVLGKEINIPILVPKKQITISYLYYPPLTWKDINISVESDEGSAKKLNVIPTPNLSGWKKGILYLLLFVGSSTVIYAIIILFVTLFQHY